jgi:DNA-binding MarR family transcriptional regulator
LARLITNDGKCRRGLATSYVGTALHKLVIKGKVERSTGVTERRVRRRKHRTDDLKGRREYGKVKEKHKIAMCGELAVDLS